MEFAIYNLIPVISFADRLLAEEKSLVENISIIVGIFVGIAGLVIAYLTYRASKKKREEKQNTITAGGSVATGQSKVEHEEAGEDIIKTEGEVLKADRDAFKAGRDILKVDKIVVEKTEQPAEEVEALWPKESLPPVGGVKVSEPFAGREEELKELGKAMTAGKTIAAVVGMAGQGKSCLAGEWYKRGARPPKGVGLFWRKVYEAGYTFDRFVDDFHFYLIGEHIDRRRVRTVEERAAMVEAILRKKPCWVVLDGVERWLKRWAIEPDAGVENLTVDDRAGQDGTLLPLCHVPAV